MKNFGERIKELRTKNKLSGTELGEKVGVTRYAISKWETGESTAPQNMVIKLSEYFNVSTDYLLGKTEDPRPFPPDDNRSIEEKILSSNDRFVQVLYEVSGKLTETEKEEVLNFVDYLMTKSRKEKQGL